MVYFQNFVPQLRGSLAAVAYLTGFCNQKKKAPGTGLVNTLPVGRLLKTTLYDRLIKASGRLLQFQTVVGPLYTYSNEKHRQVGSSKGL